VLGAIVLLTSFLVGSARAERVSSGPQYRLVVSDQPDLKRFLLTLTSVDRRPLCLHVTKWPDYFGHVHFGSSWVTLTATEGKYPARDENFGTCIGPSCVIRIAPGGKLSGFIGYSEFGDPKRISKLSNRKLKVVTAPIICRH
jgi:hypothetical protein